MLRPLRVVARESTALNPVVSSLVAALQRAIATGTPSVAAAARRIGVSEGHLWRRCRSELGRTPQDLLTAHRLDEGERLLRETEAPIAAIATRVGFALPRSFSTAFRRRFGHAPRNYRRMLQGADDQP